MLAARGIVQDRINPLEERMMDYVESTNLLRNKMLSYKWQYRKNVCAKCPLETQQKLECQREHIFKKIDGVVLQATNCEKINKAVSKKYQRHMTGLSNLYPNKSFSKRVNHFL